MREKEKFILLAFVETKTVSSHGYRLTLLSLRESFSLGWTIPALFLGMGLRDTAHYCKNDADQRLDFYLLPCIIPEAASSPVWDGNGYAEEKLTTLALSFPVMCGSLTRNSKGIVKPVFLFSALDRLGESWHLSPSSRPII